MPRGTPESATRLAQGEKAGRGSLLRLAARTFVAGIGYEVLNQLAPTQTAEAATNEQKNRREVNSTQSAIRQETAQQPTSPKKELVAEDIIPPIPDGILIIGGVIAIGTPFAIAA